MAGKKSMTQGNNIPHWRKARLTRRIMAWMAAGFFAATSVAMGEAPILPDTHAPSDRQPLVQETASGIPLVQITAPTRGGVSRNHYENFNVPAKGAVLNNSYRMSKTELAGYVQGNSNMARGTAKIIVNEVTSARPTRMEGFLEVAGDRASVVIANPNGITVNGGGFLNTNRAVLTTGKPVYDGNGSLNHFDITRGTISLEGKGLEGRKAESVAVLARAVKANAGIWADKLHVVTGASRVNADTYEAAAISGDGTKPDVALDVSAIGGMYAGVITMVGTEKGLGVNMEGTLSATEAISLSNNGDLKVSGVLYSRGDARVKAENVYNSRTMAAAGDLSITAEKDITNTDTLGAGIDEKGNLNNKGTLSIAAGNTITNDGAHILAGKDAVLKAKTFSNRNGGELYSGGKGEIHTESLQNDRGTIAGKSALTIESDVISSVKGKMASAEDIYMQGNRLDQTEGTMAADGNITLSVTGDFINRKGTITSKENTSIQSGSLTLDGLLAAGKDLSLETKGNVTNKTSEDGWGITKAGGNLTLSTDGTIDNTKKLEAGYTLTLRAKDLINEENASLNGGNIVLHADKTIDNTGLISADKHVSINAGSLVNRENGRIYGNTISITANTIENRKNKDLEDKLQKEMDLLHEKEEALEAVFQEDVTAFKNDGEKNAWFQRITEKTKDYDAQKALVDAVGKDMDGHKSSAIAARETLSITGNTLLNSADALLYSEGDMDITAKEIVTNRGARIEAGKDLSITAPVIENRNDAFSAKRVQDGGKQLEDLIRIDEGGHPEHGKAFKRSEFSNLDSGYGAYHNKNIHPMETYDLAGYAKVEAPDPDDIEEGDPPFDESLIGTEAPNYDYDDPIFQKLGVTSMTTPRPAQGDPKQAEWDKEYKTILDTLNVKIEEYNKKAEAYNQSIGAVESAKIKLYTIIRQKEYTSHEEVTTTNAGEITSGKDMALTGNVTNENSCIIAGGSMDVKGKVDNIAKENQEMTITFGTTQESYTKKKKWPHKAWRRHYRDQIFMTPTEAKGNTVPLDVAEYGEIAGNAPQGTDITETARDNVTNALNPFAQNGGKPETAGGQVMTDTITLPDNAIYHITDSSTSRYLVETDPAFINKKNFLSSDYMYEQMKWDPDRTKKRLGDGYYEQELVRRQIMNATGSRYLNGYSDDESEYKALMDAGVAYAKEHNLTPGIALSKEQMAALTSDIVWLETRTVTVNGKTYDVLYPHVYLRPGKDAMTLSRSGSLMSARNLTVETKEVVTNTGSLFGNTIAVKAGFIDNKGHVEGKTVDLGAAGDIRQEGLIMGEDNVSLAAGGTITMGSTVEQRKNQDVLNTTAGIAVKGKDGVLLMSAGKDIHITGAALASLGDKGSILLKAGQNVTMDTHALSAKKDMTENQDNYLRTYRKTETANTVTAGGSITVEAGENVSARNTYVGSDHDSVTLKAGRNITVENGYNESRDEYGIQYKESGFLSKKTTTIKSEDYSKTVSQSGISGKNVAMEAGNDITVTGSTAAGEGDVSLTAGRNVIVESAESESAHAYQKQVKKSGLLSGGGLGFTIGKEKKKDKYDEDNVTQKGAAIFSEKGSVTIKANDDVHVKASNVIAGKDITLEGKNVNIESKDNIYTSAESHEYKRSGLSVSIGGGAVDVLGGASSYASRGSEVRDDQLKALYGIKIYETLKKGAAAYKKDKNSMKPSINVGFGSSSYQSQGNSRAEIAQGSQVMAGGDVRIKTMDDITVHGSDVAGKNVTLDAGKDIHITSAANTTSTRTDSKGRSSGAGISFSPSGNSVYVTSSKGKGTEEETIITHKSSHVSAVDTLTMKSGKDTDIKGSQVSGNKVNADIKGNLSIDSEQNKDIYHNETQSSGLSLNAGISGTAAGQIGLNGQKTDGKTHSNYESVTEQAGIYAGQDGYDITVKGNTDLKGSVIDSEAPAEKNHLTTGTLTWNDIDNKADYKASASGTVLGAGHAEGKGTTGSIRPIETQDVKDNAQSSTKSAVAQGTVTITDKNKQKQDIKDLNRDSKNSLNKLAEIFDKKDVKERQELVNTFSEIAYEKAGDIAAEQGWSKNDSRRAILHGFIGSLTSAMGGGNALSGGLGAGTMEALQPVLDKYVKEYPWVREYASVIIGKVAGAIGNDQNAGAANALAGTRYNWLSHQQKETKDELIAKAREEGNDVLAEKISAYYDQLDKDQDETIEKIELPQQDEYGKETEDAIINSNQVYSDLENRDYGFTVTIELLRIAKEQGMTGYHFGNEDFVTLSGSLGAGLGVTGGFLMDRTGNIYYSRGAGFVFGASAGLTTGKFKEDTSKWTEESFKKAITGIGYSSGLTLGVFSGAVSVSATGTNREFGIGSNDGLSVSATLGVITYICNIDEL